MKRFAKIVGWTALSVVCLMTLCIGGVFGVPYWNQRPVKDCPLLARITPIPNAPIADTDHIEISGRGGLSRREPIQVTVYGDGRVERETTMTFPAHGKYPQWTFGCPLHPEDRTAHISAADAKSIIAFARDHGFCRLCESYGHRGQIWDAGSSDITLTLAGVEHHVWVHAGQPPAVYGDTYEKVVKISGIGPLADTQKFSPARDAECRAFAEQQDREADKLK